MATMMFHREVDHYLVWSLILRWPKVIHCSHHPFYSLLNQQYRSQGHCLHPFDQSLHLDRLDSLGHPWEMGSEGEFETMMSQKCWKKKKYKNLRRNRSLEETDQSTRLTITWIRSSGGHRTADMVTVAFWTHAFELRWTVETTVIRTKGWIRFGLLHLLLSVHSLTWTSSTIEISSVYWQQLYFIQWKNVS